MEDTISFAFAIFALYLLFQSLGSLIFILYGLFYPIQKIAKKYINLTHNWNQVLTDKKDLRKWYHDNIKRQKYTQFVKIIVFITILFGLFIFFEIQSFSLYEQYHQSIKLGIFKFLSSETMLIIELIIQVLVFLTIAIYIASKLLTELKNRLSNLDHKLNPIDIDEGHPLFEIKAMMLLQKEKMNIQRNIQIALRPLSKVTSSSEMMSIFVFNNESTLVLSPSALKLFSTNKNKFEAILTHELSHVLQKDANFWLVTNIWVENVQLAFYKYIPYTLFLFIPFALRDLYLCLKLYLANVDSEVYETLLQFPFLKIFFYLLILFCFEFIVIELIKTRRRGEELADTATILFSNGYVMLDILSELEQREISTPKKIRKFEEEILLQLRWAGKLKKIGEEIVNKWLKLENKCRDFLKLELRIIQPKKKDEDHFAIHPSNKERRISLELKLNKLRSTA